MKQIERTNDATTDIHRKLLIAIGRVDRPGTVSVSRDLPLTMPGLEVDGLGAIAFPLGKTQARRLIKQSSQAPYGKGTETLVDTAVRKVWEMDPDQFRLTNPKWNELISTITSEVQVALGLNDTLLKAHLYKLLIYEEGGFFLSHRDGEKHPGMVATLIIGLPSPHTGGELIVTHEGRRHEIPLAGAASGHEMSYAAFYADCEHEVLPVRDGYRLCLVYNMTLARTGRKKIGAPQTATVIEALRDQLRIWQSGDEISKLAIPLAHQYTRDGLKFEMLKGIDRARADALFDAAEQADCVAHLALMTHWQNGSAEGSYEDDYYSRRRRRSRWSDEDDENEDGYDDGFGEVAKVGKHVMGEVYDESRSVDHWSDRSGNTIDYGEIDLDKDEIVAGDSLDEWLLGREEYEGYTGNAGMTLERWYHRAAVVIWPRKQQFAILCQAGTDAAIAGLGVMINQWKAVKKSDAEQLRASCQEFARAIFQSWAARTSRYSSSAYETKPVHEDRSVFPLLLQELDDFDLFNRFLNEVMPQEAEIQLGQTFLAFAKRHGWQEFEAGLAAVMRDSLDVTISRNVALLEVLSLKRDKDAGRLGLCRQLASVLMEGLERVDLQKCEYGWQVIQINRPELLASLVRSLIAIDATTVLTKLISHVTSHAAKYDLTDVQLAAIFDLEPWLVRKLREPNPTITDWLASCRKELEQRTAMAPAAPADYRRSSKLSCTCSYCKELSQFLADPYESVHRFRVRKELRRHLHGVIDGNGCDLTHVTDRSGSPQTLVCTKTTALYQAACKIHARDLENLKRLRAIEAKLNQVGTRHR